MMINGGKNECFKNENAGTSNRPECRMVTNEDLNNDHRVRRVSVEKWLCLSYQSGAVKSMENI